MMEDSNKSEYSDVGLDKYLKVIAEQQKKQTEYLRNISAVFTCLLITAVLFLLLFSLRIGIF